MTIKQGCLNIFQWIEIIQSIYFDYNLLKPKAQEKTLHNHLKINRIGFPLYFFLLNLEWVLEGLSDNWLVDLHVQLREF